MFADSNVDFVEVELHEEAQAQALGNGRTTSQEGETRFLDCDREV